MAKLIRKGEKNFPDFAVKDGIKPVFLKEQYCDMVEKSQAVHPREIFSRVSLSDPMKVEAERRPVRYTASARAANPSPYMFCYSGDDLELSGASRKPWPSWTTAKLSTFPLAGTRPQGKTPDEDKTLEADPFAG